MTGMSTASPESASMKDLDALLENADGVARRDLPDQVRWRGEPAHPSLSLHIDLSVQKYMPTFIFLLLHRAQASCERLSRRGSAGDAGSPLSFFLRLRAGPEDVGVGGGIISCCPG